MQHGFGYFVAVLAINIFFLLVAAILIPVRITGRRVRKGLERTAMAMAIPLLFSAFDNFVNLRPLWNVITPLLAALFIFAEGFWDPEIKNRQLHLMLIHLRTLFFIMISTAMAFYAFAFSTGAGWVTLLTLTVAGWAGFYRVYTNDGRHQI